MPYHWVKLSAAPEQSGAVSIGRPLPRRALRIWPNRSLSLQGFVGFIGLTAALIALPLLALLGSPALWGILPFCAASLTGLYFAFKRNYRDGGLYEEIAFWEDLVRVTHQAPGKAPEVWEANPHWLRVEISAQEDAATPYALSLTASGRSCPIGAFLAPEERQALAPLLRQALRPD